MTKTIHKITKIEIKSLWNRFDLTWSLNPDVNILSGINGSGKSTILDCVASLISTGNIDDAYQKLVEKITITFDYDRCLVFEHIQDTIKNIELKAKRDPKYKAIVSDIRESEGNDYKKIKSVSLGMVSLDTLRMTLDELHESLKINIISTFDNEIPDAGRRPDESVKTELDRDIFKLQKQYLDYQLNISKKKDQILNIINLKEDIEKLKYPQNKFIEIIDSLFIDTGKKINRAKNEIAFLCGTNDLSPYQLSAGEKQILVILLTALVQDNQAAILLMDEPEISLHFNWQKKLIQYIRELNPNVQIILATHSPAVIIEGWHDKVSEISDLITLDKQQDKK